MGKFSLGLGIAVGYVLGARAGRDRYEQIAQAAAGFVQRPEVQQTLEKARSAAPAPLQGTIDKLAGGGSGGSGSGSGAGTAADSGVIEGEATMLGDVDVIVTPPPPAVGSPGTADDALPDPLLPPAKSGDSRNKS